MSYEHLVDSFWQIHNPTTLNRQGWDFGDQYRSAIFVQDADQMTAAVASRAHAQQSMAKPIVTQIEAGPFYEAEPYHQQYFEKQGGGACAVAIEVPTPAQLNRSASDGGLTR